jgi:hypothetical protein
MREGPKNLPWFWFEKKWQDVFLARCRNSLLSKAVSGDEGLEVEVTDPKDEVGECEAGKAEGKDELKLERLQCR